MKTLVGDLMTLPGIEMRPAGPDGCERFMHFDPAAFADNYGAGSILSRVIRYCAVNDYVSVGRFLRSCVPSSLLFIAESGRCLPDAKAKSIHVSHDVVVSAIALAERSGVLLDGSLKQVAEIVSRFLDLASLEQLYRMGSVNFNCDLVSLDSDTEFQVVRN